MPVDLAILYEHPSWFEPLFAALEQRAVPFVRIPLDEHHFDLAAPPPARVILNRLSMSAFVRSPRHPIFYVGALLSHWESQGVAVINGTEVHMVDTSKARQLALLGALDLAIPPTRVVYRPEDLVVASAAMRFPLLIKANVGGAGAGIARYENADDLIKAVEVGDVPQSIDQVLLLQEWIPARGGTILRLETLGGRFLYALEVETGGENFDLCPADACQPTAGKPAVRMRAIRPPNNLIAAAEAIAKAVGFEVGGVEVVIDERDGTPRFYDINGLSNFVGRPMEVLGWDPHERLVDYLVARIAKARQ